MSAPQATPPPARDKSSFATYAKPEHKAVARMMGYSLTLRDEPAAWNLATVLYARLTADERTFVAFAAAMALEPNERMMLREML